MKALSRLELTDLSPNEFPRTHEALQEALRERVATAFALGLWSERDPDRGRVAAYGTTSSLADQRPVRAATAFDLSSVTKILATAPLAALLVERRWISWGTPLASLLPGYPFAAGIRLGHLLSHTAGLPAWVPFYEKLRERFAPLAIHEVPIADRQHVMRELVFSIPPEKPPEERALYSDLSFLLLGFALEEALAMPLDRAVKDMIWSPLGLRGTYYHSITKPADRDRDLEIPMTESSDWRGGWLQGQVHDENCWAMGGYGGHAGAFGTALDLLGYSAALMTGYFSAETLRAMWTRVPMPSGCERTLGWDTRSPGPESMVGSLMSPGAVGHWGFTGTSLWIDPKRRIAIALLTNRVHPSRENARIRAFRPKIHDTLIREYEAAFGG